MVVTISNCAILEAECVCLVLEVKNVSVDRYARRVDGVTFATNVHRRCRSKACYSLICGASTSQPAASLHVCAAAATISGVNFAHARRRRQVLRLSIAQWRQRCVSDMGTADVFEVRAFRANNSVRSTRQHAHASATVIYARR